MRRLALFGAALALGALAPWALSAGGSAQSPDARTIELVSRPTAAFGFVDNPPRSKRRFPRGGVSAGDLLASEDAVFDRASGERVGRLHTACIATRPARSVLRGNYQCTGTYVLRDGKITTSAVGTPSRAVETLAITGGTGAYEGARGSVTSRMRRDDSFVDTLRLLP